MYITFVLSFIEIYLEEEEEIYLTQINNNHGNSTPIVTEPGCQKTRRSTMLATHRIQELLTLYTKNNKKTYKYAPVAITNNKVQKVHNVYSNADQV